MPHIPNRMSRADRDPAELAISAPGDPSARNRIVIRGARQNNLKNVSLELPRNKLIVFTGPSGSGKSSLAFDTIYAEGQRRYTESLSAYARQFLERMDKPDVDLITGLSPAIAIEQRSTTRNPRSTVATQTEVYDHLRLLFARVGRTFSPVSGEEVTRDSPRSVARSLQDCLADGARFYVCCPLPAQKRVTQTQTLRILLEKGFFRILVLPTPARAKAGEAEQLVDLTETAPDDVKAPRNRVLVLIDRLVMRRGDPENESRIADSVEMAFREGEGRCVIQEAAGRRWDFSEFFERDGMRFEEPTPQLFSFNSPLGACPTCQGFGQVPGIDPDLVIPNPDLSIRQGAIAPFRTEKWGKYYRDLIRLAAQERIPIDTPYRQLPPAVRDLVWQGQGEYDGIHGFFQFLERHNYKMHYRMFAARFRGYTRCRDCDGYRLRAESLHVKINGLHIGEICELTTKDALDFVESLTLSPYEQAVAGRVLIEITKRLRYLNEVGLDYLTLDRLSHTLSGGESQRINLATSLGSSLVGSLYVLDEPSIGLHPRDTNRLIRILENLRDIGNTVIVVEHDSETMERADFIVDMGPGAGDLGGHVVFQGTYPELLNHRDSLTGAYLSGRMRIPVPPVRRTVEPDRVIHLENARANNLKRINVDFPLDMIVCVTGVSGSGKSTLVHDTLYAGIRRLRGESTGTAGLHDSIQGYRLVDETEMVDQSPIGQTPRSNPVTYVKAFDDIRTLLSETHQARIRGYKPGYFSFNVPGGRCEVCQGAGVVKIEMQFLADLYLECEACKGKRFKQDVLEVRLNGKNVDDILRMTIDEALDFFEPPRIRKKLQVLQDVGLGYLRMGQPATTLSGGEAQRVKLAYHLSRNDAGRTLYLFDEPTTGLHVDDIRKLLTALNALVEQGHSVIVIEHNTDVLKCADWIIDMGPEGGIRGGFIVAEGPPEAIAARTDSHTGRYLRELL